MAFYLEERDAGFLLKTETPLIGPGQYEQPSFADKVTRKAKSQGKRQRAPAFNQTTKREILQPTSYNPPPGYYNA